jgi:3-hydroxyisobutyrate dehydrogenase
VVSGPPIRRVGVVGAGALGLPLAAVTAAAGFEVRVHDRDPDRVAAATRRGLASAATLGALADWADCVITVLPSAADLAGVVGGADVPGDSLTGARRPGLLVVDVGSGAPVGTRELAVTLAGAGHHLVDAPVSGSPQRAEEATLVAMIGGDEGAADAAETVLAASCPTRLRLGGPGAGHAAKVVNNLLAATHLAATVEALLLARAAGYDPAAMLTAVNELTGASYASQVKLPRFVLPGSYDSGFPVRALTEDLDNGAGLFGLLDRPPLVSGAARQLWSEAAADLGGGADHTAVAAWLETRHGLRLTDRVEPAPHPAGVTP